MAVMSMFTMGIQPDIPAGHFAVSLSVVTEDRLNMSGASFTLMGDGGTFTAVSDASGRAYVEAPSGPYTVSIVHAGEYTGDAPQTLDAESRNHYGVLFDLRLPRVMETDPRVPTADGSEGNMWVSDGSGGGRWTEPREGVELKERSYTYRRVFSGEITPAAASLQIINTALLSSYTHYFLNGVVDKEGDEVLDLGRQWDEGRGLVYLSSGIVGPAYATLAAEDRAARKGDAVTAVVTAINTWLRTLVGQSVDHVAEDGTVLRPRGTLYLALALDDPYVVDLYEGSSSATSSAVLVSEDEEVDIVAYTGGSAGTNFFNVSLTVGDDGVITAVSSMTSTYFNLAVQAPESGYRFYSADAQTLRIRGYVRCTSLSVMGSRYPMPATRGLSATRYTTAWSEVLEFLQNARIGDYVVVNRVDNSASTATYKGLQYATITVTSRSDAGTYCACTGLVRYSSEYYPPAYVLVDSDSTIFRYVTTSESYSSVDLSHTEAVLVGSALMVSL